MNAFDVADSFCVDLEVRQYDRCSTSKSWVMCWDGEEHRSGVLCLEWKSINFTSHLSHGHVFVLIFKCLEVGLRLRLDAEPSHAPLSQTGVSTCIPHHAHLHNICYYSNKMKCFGSRVFHITYSFGGNWLILRWRDKCGDMLILRQGFIGLTV